MSRIRRLLIPTLILGLFVGCSSRQTIASHRSRAWTSERISKEGSICLIESSPHPPDHGRNAREIATIENAFRAKGFSFGNTARGADYGLTLTTYIRDADHVRAHKLGENLWGYSGFIMGLTVEVHELHSDGSTGRTLWHARMAGKGDPASWEIDRPELLRRMLAQFPN